MRPTRAAVISCDVLRLNGFLGQWAALDTPLPLRTVHSARTEDYRIGCWLGHLSALVGDDPLLVFEDDAVLLLGFTPYVDWPDDCEIGYYGCTLGTIPKVVPGPIQRVWSAWRTHAYVAAHPSELAERLGPPAGGHLTDSPGWRGSVRYALRPATVVQAA